MIKWTEYVRLSYLAGNSEIIIRVEYKLKKNKSARIPDEKAKKKKAFVWTKKRKIAAGVIGAGFLSLVIFAVMIFVFDLGPIKEIPSSEEEARVVGKCGEYEVRFEELRYLTLLYREELDAKYGKYDTLSQSEKAEYEKELEEKVTDGLKSNYVILTLCERYGIDTDSRESRKYVRDTIEEHIDELGGKEKYLEWLKKNNMTDTLVRFIFNTNYLESALLEHLTKSKEEIKYTTANLDEFVKFVMEDESYVKAIHVFYPRGEHVLYSQRGSDMRSEVESAQEQLSVAKSDEERYEIMKSVIANAPYVQGYSVDGMGSYLTYGQMHEKYESAAFALDDYEASEIVELEEGCYIIMRMPKVRDEVARHAYEYIEYYRYAVLKQLKDAEQKKIEFNPNEYFDSLKLVEIK